MVLSLFLFLLKEGKAQYEFTTLGKNAYRDVLRLKTQSKAVKAFLAEAQPSENAFDIYVQNYLDIIALLSVDNPIQYHSLRERESIRLAQLKKIGQSSESSPNHRFIQAGIKLQWAVVKLKYEDNFAAFWAFKKGYQLLEKNEEEYPDFLPHKQWLGIMKVMFSQVPSRYQWLLDLMGMQGDKSTGLAYLEILSEGESVFSYEATMYRAFLQLFVLKQEEQAYQTFTSFFRKDASNLLALFALTQTALKLGENREVLPLLTSLEITAEYGNLSIFHHLKGQLYLQAGHYNACIQSLYQFLKEFEGENYRKDCHFRMAMAFCFLNQSDSSRYHLAQINEVGSAKISLDKYAMSFVSKKPLFHKQLTQARFYTDGGYFGKALQCLENIRLETLNAEDKIEYYYRKGRIFQLSETWDEAIAQYENVLRHSAYNTTTYYPANTALQLGIIYAEQKNDNVQVGLYLQEVFKYKGDYPYRAEIRDKASQWLKETAE